MSNAKMAAVAAELPAPPVDECAPRPGAFPLHFGHSDDASSVCSAVSIGAILRDSSLAAPDSLAGYTAVGLKTAAAGGAVGAAERLRPVRLSQGGEAARAGELDGRPVMMHRAPEGGPRIPAPVGGDGAPGVAVGDGGGGGGGGGGGDGRVRGRPRPPLGTGTDCCRVTRLA